VKFKGLSDVGKVRQNNEDNFYCNDENNLFIVADGLGGHTAGEIASKMAVEFVVSKSPKTLEELVDTLTQANSKVFEEAQKIENDMATTMSAMIIDGDKAYIAHVGDSRIYLVRGSSIHCITNDHTPVMDSLRAGLITEEQAKYHPLKHMLSRTIGTHPSVEIDPIIVELLPEDVFVLCTDGLSNLLENEDIFFIVKANHMSDSDAIAKELVDTALERGGIDNTTVVVVYLDKNDIPVLEAE